MRRNRIKRDRLQEAGGIGLVQEVERWNDLGVDSLSTYGVPVSPTEEQVQSDMLELMAVEEAHCGSS